MIYVAHDSISEAKPYSLPLFERVFKFRYVHRLTFDHYESEQWLRKQCERAYQQGMIDPLKLWLGKYHRHILDKDTTPDITIRWISDEIGYGVFTNRPIRQWECIGEYAGVVRRRDLFSRTVNDYCFMYPRAWITLKPYTIDSAREGNFTRLVNHSDTPNLEAISALHEGVFRILLRAIRPIQAGEELNYDYGPIYWRDRKKLVY